MNLIKNLGKPVIRACVVIGLFTVSIGALPRQVFGQTPAQATFADSAGDRIRSDGLGTYADDALDSNSCVRSWVTTNRPGKAFMRTGQHPDFCSRPTAPERELVLDFSAPVAGFPSPCLYATGTEVLDACGINSVRDVRIVAENPNPFYSGTTASDVNLLFNLLDSFPNNTFDFTLEFDDLVPVPPSLQVPGEVSRTVRAGPAATATLYRYDRTNPKKPKKLFVATYYMPFAATYTFFQ